MLVHHAVQELDCDTLIIGIPRPSKRLESRSIPLVLTARAVDQQLDGLITSICVQGEFKGNLGETTQIYTMDKLAVRRVVLLGLGPQEALQSHTFRRACGIGIRFAQSKGARRVALALDVQAGGVEEAAALQAAVEGVLLATYTFKKYQTAPTSTQKVEQLQFLVSAPDQPSQHEALRQGIAMARASNFARDLVNEPSDVLTPTELANRTRVMARQFELECEVLDRAQMANLGMGGLLAVTRGSVEAPQFIILHYRGRPRNNTKDIALIGKGVTFDSGGLSLKTVQGMETMKGDMAGGAAVIGAMQVVAALKPEINVTALVPATENMVDGASFRPGDILRLMNGKTIEIVNTDAEGRLALADALSYAVKEGYTTLIDIATLTGSCRTALGMKRAGLFCNRHELEAELMSTGEAVGEKLWPMPLDDDYLDLIESPIADMRQTGGRFGGAITAAKVLEHFVGTARWGHLDICGLEINETRSVFQEAGATGFGTRLLATFLLNRAKQVVR